MRARSMNQSGEDGPASGNVAPSRHPKAIVTTFFASGTRWSYVKGVRHVADAPCFDHDDSTKCVMSDCGWIGNTERIARRHYLQITEADFDQVIGLQRAAKIAAISSSEYAQLAQDETKEPRFPAQNAVNAVPQLSSFAQDRT